MQMYCIAYNNSMVMELPLQVLPPLGADFDGDTLNIFLIINDKFFERSNEIFNPRNAMYISHNDGNVNPAVLVQRDTLINANTLLYLGRDKYSQAQMDKIMNVKKKQQAVYGIY